MEKFSLTANDGLDLAVILAEAKEQEPRAIIQMIHGAQEHKERYVEFIEFLTEKGFTVMISDNRGHGASINAKYPLGFMNGVTEIIDDQLLITNYLKQKYPGKDLFLFGHSLGSLFARIYLQEHDDEIKKLVLSGTANYVPLVRFGVVIGKVVTMIKGKHGYSKLLRWLNGNSADDSWLSANLENLERYRNDPLCQYDYQNGAMLTVFEADWNMHRFQKFQCKNPDLEILSVVGDGDPVTGGEKGLKDTVESLQRIGYHNITSKVYRGMKHEVLNEVERHLVYEDIAQFFLT